MFKSSRQSWALKNISTLGAHGVTTATTITVVKTTIAATTTTTTTAKAKATTTHEQSVGQTTVTKNKIKKTKENLKKNIEQQQTVWRCLFFTTVPVRSARAGGNAVESLSDSSHVRLASVSRPCPHHFAVIFINCVPDY